MKAIFTALLSVVLLTVSCSTDMHKDRGKEVPTVGTVGGIGGFWEGYNPFMKSDYYGFTFVQSRDQLLGTCFEGVEGHGDGIRLYYLENCKIQGNHFEGRKMYPPWKLGEMVEGTFDGDSCQFIEYYTEGHAEITLHRVAKLSKTPTVFRDPPEKK